MDALSIILDSVRLAGCVLSVAHLGRTFAVSTRGASSGIFHAVLAGRAIACPASGGRVELGRGDVIVLGQGDAHVLCDSPDRASVPVLSLARRTMASGIEVVEASAGARATRILCGTFRIDHDASAALLSLLPRVMHVRRDPSDGDDRLAATLDLMERELYRDEPGTSAVLARLTDVLFVHVLRRHAAELPGGTRGWLAALRDEHVGRALALIHEDPGQRWDVRTLAARAGTSRTLLFERFTALVGEPPARYVARWRIRAAADLLRRSRIGTATVAQKAGYASEDAFVKAFRRHLGVSPSEYRRRAAGSLRGAGP